MTSQMKKDKRVFQGRRRYERPLCEVHACAPQQMVAATVRAQGSDWLDGGEEEYEFNFTSSSGAKEGGGVTFSDVWE